MKIEFLDRIRRIIAAFYATKIGKILSLSSFAFIFLCIGAYSMLLYKNSGLTFLQQLYAFIGTILAPSGAILLGIEKFFSIEVKEKELQKLENDINLKCLDENIISNNIVEKVIPMLKKNINNNVDIIYEERERHYKYEKELLAHTFEQLMQKRIEFLKARKIDKIQIFFDSGSTIRPLA